MSNEIVVLNKNYIILIVILLIAAVTNPDEAKHQRAAAKFMSKKIKNSVDTESADALMGDGFSSLIVSGVSKFMITSKSYLLFSLTQKTIDDETIGIGAFGYVLLFAEIEGKEGYLEELKRGMAKKRSTSTIESGIDSIVAKHMASDQSAATTPAQQSNTGSAKSNSFTDSRDSKTYKMVKIGSQTWMAQNLNYAASGSVCYENSADNCNKYGRLYNWSTARTACPAGWHLPSDAELKTLTDYVGGEVPGAGAKGTKLKSTSGWNGNGNGTDGYGFSALPGGAGYSDGSFRNVGKYGSWWSATEYSANESWYRYIAFDQPDIERASNIKTRLLSVRCVHGDAGSATANMDSKLFGTWGDAGDGGDVAIFRTDGSFLYVESRYDKDDADTFTGTWYTGKSELFLAYHKNKVVRYSNKIEEKTYYFTKDMRFDDEPTLLNICSKGSRPNCVSFLKIKE